MNPNLPTGETMSEGGPFPPEEAAEMTATLDQCIPLDAIKQPDDSDQMVAPEVGDEVSYSVTGKVTRVEGDMVYVTPSSVNGNEVTAPAPGDSLQALEQEAQGMTL